MVDGILPHESALRISNDDFIDKDRLSHQPIETSSDSVREVYLCPNDPTLRTEFHRRLSEGKPFEDHELFAILHSIAKVEIDDD